MRRWITKNGHPVARLVPAPSDRLADLIARGLVRPPRADTTWTMPEPVHVEGPSTDEVLDELRAERL